MATVVENAYAKLNLFLQVLGKRQDGYHEIRTIFQTIDLKDDVFVEDFGERIVVESESKEIPAGLENIAGKAAHTFLEKAGLRKGVRIRIKKRIPVAAGLAGGSADAAAVLRALNKLFETGYDEEVLCGLAAKLGSDVPLLIKGGTSLGEGRGEIIKALNPVPKTVFVLVKEGIKSSTGEIYAKVKKDLTKESVSDIKIDSFIKGHYRRGGDLSSFLLNELEEPASGTNVRISEVKAELQKAGAKGVLMTGSGPTVFGIFLSEEKAKEAAGKMTSKFGWVTTAKTLDRY